MASHQIHFQLTIIDVGFCQFPQFLSLSPSHFSADGPDSQSPPKVHGLPNHVPPEMGKNEDDLKNFNPKDGGIQAFGLKPSQMQISGIPVCPNGLNAMQYSDGRFWLLME
jgi:hypothetical protein